MCILEMCKIQNCDAGYQRIVHIQQLQIGESRMIYEEGQYKYTFWGNLIP